ncbi:hypothetical protein BB934_45390 (plasmid) [Microvirga ossetica]|uniref:Uncharacterized protein n=1 Tax=Microvirga ossetica TaxID=1882682 RepID=A0A1B2EZR7_9HYPH|nr:hypothetical protein [Microvirga ossetica]ANY85456.1 hypothetical protein BB934_45390 [Microvirga ossetica]
MTNTRNATAKTLTAVITIDADDVVNALRDVGKARGRDDEHMRKFAAWLMGDRVSVGHIEDFGWDELRRNWFQHHVAEEYESFIGETEGWPDEQAA